jgi:hypothetical protein
MSRRAMAMLSTLCFGLATLVYLWWRMMGQR